MAKVMLVEDDNNLREIYEARLAAEGYEIVAAADGEAALALAIKEKPDLIISDIMMPKVSGFDMLDILRSTTETKDSKIIMMTALNQAEDKARAEKLGADMYLVKSQVTLEDVVRAAKSVLGDQTPLSVGGIPVQHPEPATPANATSLTGGTPSPTPTPVNSSPAPAPAPETPPATPNPVAVTPEPVAVASTTQQEEAALEAQINQFISTDDTKAQSTPSVTTSAPTVSSPAPAPAPETPPATPNPVAVTPSSAPAPEPSSPPAVQVSSAPLTVAPEPQSADNNEDVQTTSLDEDKPAGEQIIVKSAPSNSNEPGIDASVSGRKKVIQPISDVLAGGPDLNALAAKEATTTTAPVINSVVTPEGVTMQSPPAATAPTMNDVIAPSPTPPAQPSAPVPPPVA